MAGKGGATPSPAPAALTDSAVATISYADSGPPAHSHWLRNSGHAHLAGKCDEGPARSSLAFDASGPPTEAESFGCAVRRACAPGKRAAPRLTFSEVYEEAAVALFREHGCYTTSTP